MLRAHLRALVKSRTRALQRSLDFEGAQDPVEAVHDLRVACRRLRALASAIDRLGGDVRVKHAGQLRRIARAAGALRDADVLSAQLKALHETAVDPTEQAAIEHVLETLASQRELAKHRALERLGSLDGETLRGALNTAFTKAIARVPRDTQAQAQLAHALLARRVERAERCARACARANDARSMHALRIACKKLRYTLEVLQPLLGARFAPLHARATELQALLGAHHDRVVLEEKLRAVRSELRQQGQRTLAAGVQRALARVRAERLELQARYRAAPFDAATFRVAGG